MKIFSETISSFLNLSVCKNHFPWTATENQMQQQPAMSRYQ